MFLAHIYILDSFDKKGKVHRDEHQSRILGIFKFIENARKVFFTLVTLHCLLSFFLFVLFLDIIHP
jgi:hypothetical protein